MELDTQLNASDRTTRETLSKNFREIQSAYDDLDHSLNRLNTRLDNLDKQKATHDEVKGLREEMLGRIRHIYMGDDHEAIRDVILQMKKNGSPVIEIKQGALRSNEFGLNGDSLISSCLMAKVSANDKTFSASVYVEFFKNDNVVGKSNTVYVVNNGAWQSVGAVNIKVPEDANKGQLVMEVSGSGVAYVSRAQVNLGYKITDWNDLK